MLKTELVGLKEAQAKAVASAKALRGGTMFTAVQRGTVTIFRDAALNTTVVTGRLRAGWNLSIASAGAVVTGVVFNPVEYAGYYELGTSKMAARRPLGRSVNKNKDQVIADIIEAVRRALP